MIVLGVISGLLAAIGQASSYIFSRLYVMRTENAVTRLFVVSHVMMGAVSVILLPFFLPEDAPRLGLFLRPLGQAAGFYLVGQFLLFRLMQKTEASRISPLLGMKLVILSLITVLVLGQHLSFQEWVAVLLCVSAAFVLNFTGGSLSRSTVLTGLILCTCYSLSDLGIADLIVSLSTADHPALLAALLTYIVCGVVGLLLLPAAGWGRVFLNWQYSVPFTLFWFVSMLCLFCCIGCVGPVLGNVLQSTRGIVSVLLGAILARMGYTILEQAHPGHVVLRRAVAALLMCVAVWLFLFDN